MKSTAYADYAARLRELLRLLRLGLASSDPLEAAACAKGTTVLSAAALERYVNDVVRLLSKRLAVDKWDELPEGPRSYLIRKIASNLASTLDGVGSEGLVPDKTQKRIREALLRASKAVEDPSQWAPTPDYGLFMRGAAEPDKLNRFLRAFDPQGRSFYDQLDQRGRDRAAMLRALSELIEARHDTAHALSERADPSPRDVQGWVVLTFWLVRGIERFVSSDLDR